MTSVTFVSPDGTRRCVEAPADLSLMEAAIRNGVPGIDGDCGGACACATCHVYVEEAFLAATGEASSSERDMLEFASDVRPNSRLACQIKLVPALDGLVVHTPATQG